MNNYFIVIEKANKNYSAFSPDVDGCIATGKTKEEAYNNYIEALEFHLEGLREDGLPIPKCTSTFAYISSDTTGVINIRTVKSMHHKLIELAKKENVSVSHLVNDAIMKVYG